MRCRGHDTKRPMAPKSVEEKLESLRSLDLGKDPARDRQVIEAALNDRHCRVVAKAAELAAERLSYELEPVLLKAYQPFLQDPVKRDPNCIAKRALARALVTLECTDVAFFLEGVRYRQMEPVWGGSVDTAIDMRNSCAMGLVATGYPRALHELTVLLNDPEARARQGAVRAIACGNPREAELLLRFKMLSGDPEPEIVGECFTALLSVAPEESVSLVAKYLADTNEAIRELAALALGESRLPEALARLREAWEEVLIGNDFRRVLVRAAALHRTDAAFDWLLNIIAEDDASLAEAVLEALAIYKQNAQLENRIKLTLAGRRERRLNDCFARFWN